MVLIPIVVGVINQLITGGATLFVCLMFFVELYMMYNGVPTQVEIYHIRSLHSECDYQEKTQYKKAWKMDENGFTVDEYSL